MVQERDLAGNVLNPMVGLSKQLADVKARLKADPKNHDLWTLRYQLRARSWELQADAIRDKLQSETRVRKQSRLNRELTFLEDRIAVEIKSLQG